jgi:hypothetical protein
MPNLREYLQKNLPAVAAKSALGARFRAVVQQSGMLDDLGDKDLEEITHEVIGAWADQRLAEPKKDGTPRSQTSVEQEMQALDDVVTHFHGAKGTAAGRAALAAHEQSRPKVPSAAPHHPWIRPGGSQRGR